MKQSSIKSQFACTYKTESSEIKGHSFFSSSRMSTCEHPAPKQHLQGKYFTIKLYN